MIRANWDISECYSHAPHQCEYCLFCFQLYYFYKIKKESKNTSPSSIHAHLKLLFLWYLFQFLHFAKKHKLLNELLCWNHKAVTFSTNLSPETEHRSITKTPTYISALHSSKGQPCKKNLNKVFFLRRWKNGDRPWLLKPGTISPFLNLPLLQESQLEVMEGNPGKVLVRLCSLIRQTNILIQRKDNSAESAAKALEGEAGRGSLFVCWWLDARGAAEKGNRPACAVDAPAWEVLQRLWRCAARDRASSWTTPGPAASGRRRCSAGWGWERPRRTSGEARLEKWNPARSSPCCNLCARWWVHSGSSRTEPAWTGGDCCPAAGRCLQTLSEELLWLHLRWWNPSTNLQENTWCKNIWVNLVTKVWN